MEGVKIGRILGGILKKSSRFANKAITIFVSTKILFIYTFSLNILNRLLFRRNLMVFQSHRLKLFTNGVISFFFQGRQVGFNQFG